MTGKTLSEQVLNFFAISMILVSASTDIVSSVIKSATLPLAPWLYEASNTASMQSFSENMPMNFPDSSKTGALVCL